MSVPISDDERSNLLRGTRNAILLVLPFWLGLIYLLIR